MEGSQEVLFQNAFVNLIHGSPLKKKTEELGGGTTLAVWLTGMWPFFWPGCKKQWALDQQVFTSSIPLLSVQLTLTDPLPRGANWQKVRKREKDGWRLQKGWGWEEHRELLSASDLYAAIILSVKGVSAPFQSSKSNILQTPKNASNLPYNIDKHNMANMVCFISLISINMVSHLVCKKNCTSQLL